MIASLMAFRLLTPNTLLLPLNTPIHPTVISFGISARAVVVINGITDKIRQTKKRVIYFIVASRIKYPVKLCYLSINNPLFIVAQYEFWRCIILIQFSKICFSYGDAATEVVLV